MALIASELTRDFLDELSNLRIPFVVLNDELEGGAPHDSVIIDQKKGAVDLMRHVVQNCHAQRVIFVGGLETSTDTRARLEATKEVLAESSIPFDEGDVHFLDCEYDTAYALASELARSWAGSGNCVFAASDAMASGIIAAATAAGFAVPRDFSVVGFDDTRIARMTRLRITTVRVPAFDMGAKAVELLYRRIEHPDDAATRITLDPELVVRDSCGCPSRRKKTRSSHIGARRKNP